MNISIVMTYYNRKNQLFRTLKSMQQSDFIDECNIIIVDDASSQEHKIDFLDQFPNLHIELIEIKPEDKWYVNPCIPFNMGLKKATGDIILIQNAECMHNGDIIRHTRKLPVKDYWTYAVSSLTYEQVNELDKLDWSKEDFATVLGNLATINAPITRDGGPGWYNHSHYRPCKYHFISAIHKTELEKIGLFREEFARGVGWEDNEFLYRISKSLSVRIIDKPFGFHQWHYNHTWDGSKIRNNNETIYRGLAR